MNGLRITEIRAFPTSFPVDSKDSVTLGIGRAVKRDAVIVKVETEGGVTGWGEAHHGRCPGAVAHLVNTTLRQLVLGQDANDTTGVWKKVRQAACQPRIVVPACALGHRHGAVGIRGGAEDPHNFSATAAPILYGGVSPIPGPKALWRRPGPRSGRLKR